MTFFARVAWWFVSVPIFIKVLGISLFVALIFGASMLLYTSGAVSRSLYHFLVERTRSDAAWLAASLERPLATGDESGLRERLARAMEMAPDFRYIIVRDAGGKIAAHTFYTKQGVPQDLQRLWKPAPLPECEIQMLGSREGLIMEARCPILPVSGFSFQVSSSAKAAANLKLETGNLKPLFVPCGWLQLGVLDTRVTAEIRALTRSVLWSLGFSMVLGSGLGLLLAHLFLTRPLYHLVRAENRVGQGDFEARAKVFSADEIGRLAAAFNQMAESLHQYRAAVEEKEKARLSLLDRIVQAQEEERKSIARELHDQVEQSLAALLLAVESNIPLEEMSAKARAELAAKLRGLSEEIHRLAWGMRPSILDDYGLDSALSRYIAEMATASGVVIDYQFSGAPDLGRLPSRVEVTLYRIAQEAVTNIVSHAQATRASIVVLRERHGVTLVAEDNGKGFDMADAAGTSGATASLPCGLGLIGMKERASLLSGTCVIESKPGAGTTIHVTIPLA